jgi:hypothetical protein
VWYADLPTAGLPLGATVTFAVDGVRGEYAAHLAGEHATPAAAVSGEGEGKGEAT